MNPGRRRKKRPNYGIRTVEVIRGPNGFGFTISGQQPCILSCIVNKSPADQAGLRAGDFLISVNGMSVSKSTHDSVVNLIGNSIGPIKMTIAENYYSDSSDEEVDLSRTSNNRKLKYAHKPRVYRNNYKHEATGSAAEGLGLNSPTKKAMKLREAVMKNHMKKPRDDVVTFASNDNGNISNASFMDEEAAPIEYKAVVGYLGTIEMPKQLAPGSRLQTVCSCIRKLRQEKRVPTAVLMTVLPTCLTLKNASNHILAIYPTNRVVYIGSSNEKESRYFGLITSAVCDNGASENELWLEKVKENGSLEISNSCHIFVTDSKLVEHSVHCSRTQHFKIGCTADVVTGNCLEFPKNSLHIVSLIQNMYKLQDSCENSNDEHLAPVANSPQPSASSNSDSGIGFRDDCAIVSDRILVVEFPTQRPFPLVASAGSRPSGITENGLLNNDAYNTKQTRYLDIDNIRCKNNFEPKKGAKNTNFAYEENMSNREHQNDLDNVRACGLSKAQTGESRLTVRAMPDPRGLIIGVGHAYACMSNNTIRDMVAAASVDMPQTYNECAVDVPPEAAVRDSNGNVSPDSTDAIDDLKCIFKTPKAVAAKTNSKRLTPKVYMNGHKIGVLSCDQLNTIESHDKFSAYCSLQDLHHWDFRAPEQKRNMAQSEPDIRFRRKSDSTCESMCDENGTQSYTCGHEGAASWAASFEKLLEDPLGLQTFAEFLKKEFSAENIYFWTACERYRRTSQPEERVSEARRIYQQHLCVGAPEPVNVDSRGRQCSEQSLQEGDESLFEQPQKQIFNLMKFDSYPRFLKSDLYRQCLSGNVAAQIEDGLMLNPPSATVSKLKKSLSNAEDRRRKSLLPWHRKNRSKSKDRGESEYIHKREDYESGDKSDLHSSRSSLTSLESSKCLQDEHTTYGKSTPLCRVILNNGITTVVQIKQSENVEQLVTRVLDKRGLCYTSFEVLTDKHAKPLNLSENSITLAGCEAKIEQRVVFKLDLPNRKVIAVKSKYTKIIVDVLRPILNKYSYKLDQVCITIGGTELINVNLPVTTIDGVRLAVIPKEEFREQTALKNTIKINSSLDEITNKVFKELLNEKADAKCSKSRSERGSVKSEDWGSEHSSGIFGRFLRRDSGLQDKNKKPLQSKDNSTHGSVEDVSSDNAATGSAVKKPLIAKWKSGVNKFQVPSSESEELYEGLKRAQRSRLEDQRGTEINFELPDFLKDKENAQASQNRCRQLKRHGEGYVLETSRFYDGEHARSESHSNYENRNITHCPSKVNNLRIYSPSKLPVAEQPVSPIKFNSAFETKRTEELAKNGEPPPLPPKPKILPIKPSNWGNNNAIFKSPRIPKSDTSKQSLYLEQPTSSFV